MNRSILSALIGLALANISSAAPALYVFGDSLSDTGNVFAATGGTYPPAPYFNGRFSNGPVWVETFASHYGYSATPSLLGGTNFAFGGAEVDPFHAISHEGTPNIVSQIAMFSSSVGSFNPNDLVAVWAGGNDFIHGSTNPVTVANQLQSELNSLYGLGARNFLVLNLPLLGFSPDYVGGPGQALANLASSTFNNQLALDLSSLQSQSGVHVHTVDLPTLQLAVLANPTAYGLTDTTHAFLGSGATDPDKFFYWDSVHPTARMHQLIGQAAIAAVPEPSTMVVFGVAALASLRRKRK